MSTITQLIRSAYVRPIRKCYIKRRNITTGVYETDWMRIDNWENKDRVINWGSVSLEINHQPAEIDKFEVSNLSMVFSNNEGHFNADTFTNSIWYGYLNRKYTKLKITCGYMDTDNTEVGVVDIFEGVIDRVIVGENQQARVTILSYQTILKKYDIKDLGLASAERTIENLMADIMNQTKITTYIPYVAATPNIANISIANPSTLEGNYWDNIVYFATITNSIPLLIGSTFSFTSRTASALSQWDFKGYGSDNQPDIYIISYYDDEGADKVRLRFQENGGSTVSISTNATLLLKYLGDLSDGSEVEFVDMANVKTANKQSILDTLIAEWENPRPVIEFDSKMFLNQLKPTDKVTVEVIQKLKYASAGRGFTWDSWTWDEPVGNIPLWDEETGAISIVSGRTWMVVKIIKNINNWTSKIKIEEIV